MNLVIYSFSKQPLTILKIADELVGALPVDAALEVTFELNIDSSAGKLAIELVRLEWERVIDKLPVLKGLATPRLAERLMLPWLSDDLFVGGQKVTEYMHTLINVQVGIERELFARKGWK